MPPIRPDRPGHASLRKGRVSLANQIYLITFTTRRRQPLFADHVKARAAARCLVNSRLWSRSRLLAWVLMPDHWHGLIALGVGDDLGLRIGLAKTNMARGIRAEAGAIGPIWAKSFHDHALRNDDEALLATARYIVMNPVRAGLVRRVGDYPYWDAIWLDSLSCPVSTLATKIL